MLHALGRMLKGQPQLKLIGLEFRDGRMEIQLDGSNISQIENLTRTISKNGELKVEILSAVSGEKGISAKLRIERVAS